jgi:SAM-dependent methyltransferase
MEPVPQRARFEQSGDAYDRFMGRYARPLAPRFAAAAGVARGQRVLDVGCGPGALTGVLADLVGADAVSAVDPSASFVTACAERHPGVDVRPARAEALPFADAEFDVALAQLVLHFVEDPSAAAHEMRRVVRPGGVVGACVWDFHEGMEMLRAFWDAANAVVPGAPDEAGTLRFGGPGEIAELLDGAGLVDVAESTITVTSDYTGFDELWSGFLEGVGPAGAFCTSLDDDTRARVRSELEVRVGRPASAFTMAAVARCAVGRVPTVTP